MENLWWIFVFVCVVVIIAAVFQSMDQFLAKIPSNKQHEKVKKKNVKQSTETDEGSTLTTREKSLDASSVKKRRQVGTSFRETLQLAHEMNVSLSSECLSESEDETIENCKDEMYEVPGRFENESLSVLKYDKCRSFIDKDDLKKEMEKAGVLHGLNNYIKNSFEKWADMELNVAVTGNSGVGKSSLINALRKLKPSDDGAAAVGVFESTTKGIKYIYPENPRVALWELPGMETQSLTKEKYFNDMNFPRFDVVIIVTAGRFQENDIWLGKELRTIRKNIIFVRTKIDIDIANIKRAYPDIFNETECLDKIRNNLSENIRLGGIPDFVSNVFLVSSPEREVYDFSNFDQELKYLLSINASVIKALLHEQVQRQIKKDQESCKYRFKGLSGFLYGWTLTFNFDSQLLDAYRKKFCIDESSLELIANELKATKSELKRYLKSYQKNHLNVGIIDKGKCLKMCAEMAKDERCLANLRLSLLAKQLKPIK
ncbi:interferon-gamma-inducible GTPase 10-like isoform X2 [Ruditapes philippinarum]|uniref:interferon-gamma-inducible GTPase 10-like isoform X2 n=1 Tax=Ruditapes philippinarum TaxID=129788 RepID=UPI00295BA56A|nr:interferon-gamma-inducible GTPase 10-like isoform X2 [Ruditapes philippinarum]